MTSKLSLPKNPTTQDFQKYVDEMVKERGFNYKDVTGQFLQLTEEIGELAKAIRKAQKMGIDKNSHVGAIDEELADIFIYLLYFCNHFNVDLEEAFRKKEEINKKRIWE